MTDADRIADLEGVARTVSRYLTENRAATDRDPLLLDAEILAEAVPWLLGLARPNTELLQKAKTCVEMCAASFLDEDGNPTEASRNIDKIAAALTAGLRVLGGWSNLAPNILNQLADRLDALAAENAELREDAAEAKQLRDAVHDDARKALREAIGGPVWNQWWGPELEAIGSVVYEVWEQRARAEAERDKLAAELATVRAAAQPITNYARKVDSLAFGYNLAPDDYLPNVHATWTPRMKQWRTLARLIPAEPEAHA